MKKLKVTDYTADHQNMVYHCETTAGDKVVTFDELREYVDKWYKDDYRADNDYPRLHYYLESESYVGVKVDLTHIINEREGRTQERSIRWNLSVYDFMTNNRNRA